MPLLISIKDHLQKKLQWEHTDLTKSTHVSSGKVPKSSTETTTSTSKQKDEDLMSAILSLQKQNEKLQSLLASKESLILSLSHELDILKQD